MCKQILLCCLLSLPLLLAACGIAPVQETAATASTAASHPPETTAAQTQPPETLSLETVPPETAPENMVLTQFDDPGIQKALTLIDAIISNDVAHGFPSAQLAIIKDGKLIYRNSWGDSNDNTLYDLASVTKMFSVVYAVQHLVTEGRLSPEMKIVDILGDRFADDTIELSYSGYAAVDVETNRAWKRSLTVRQVMTHRAGFPAGPKYMIEAYDFSGQKQSKTAVNPLFSGYDASQASRNRTLDAICGTPLMFAPETKYLYSDVDYMLMGFVVEAIVGTDLNTYLKETFWDPMGLNHITYNPLEHGFTAADCAGTELHGNTRDGVVSFPGIRTEPLQGQVHDENAWYCMGGVSGHAGLFANAEDLARLGWLMMDGTDGEHSYFSEAVIQAFTAPDILETQEPDKYGLGWWRQGNQKRSGMFGTLCSSGTVGHNGWTGTMIMIDRENGIVIALLTNKCHSPVTRPLEAPNRFDGNYFVTCDFRFVPQLLYDGMLGKAMSPDLYSLEQLMQSYADRFACTAANEALKSIQEIRAAFPDV